MRIGKPAAFFIAIASLLSSPVTRSAEGDLFMPGESLSDELLSQQRGKSDIEMLFQTNNSDQKALIQNNSISNSSTGNNSLSDNAFSDMSGIATVIQNTGNQVVIQSTTMVNVMINE